ncbi:MAG: hypothetical protein EOS29_20350 [Mesorhizobium sp.]|nr:MAG: hypothetical protein EOS29_20350 [Mesorhizobium sp.]
MIGEGGDDSRSPPLRGRCPAGQRGALSRPQTGQFGGVSPRAGLTEGWHSFAPPSALPGISPTRGEIGSVAVAQDITS